MSLGRPLGYDPSNVLEAAMQTFWVHGYDGTSLSDLLTATGLSKSSFYQAFGSKEAVFQRALAHYCQGLAARLSARLESSPSGWEFLEGVVMTAVDEARDAVTPRGCMIVNVATEFSTRDPRVSALLAEGMQQIVRIFAAAVTRAQREGCIERSRDPELMGRYVMSSLSGLRTLVKLGEGPATVAHVGSVILGALR